jgi:glutamyl-tRNA synthetase
MAALPLAERTALALPFLARAGHVGSPPSTAERALVGRIVEAAADRIKLAGDSLDYPEFFVADEELTYDAKAFDKRIRQAPGAADLLRDLRADLAVTSDFTPSSLESLFSSFTEKRGIPLGQIVHAVRVAVSGKPVGFGLFDILSILGRERVVARLDCALARLAAG